MFAVVQQSSDLIDLSMKEFDWLSMLKIKKIKIKQVALFFTKESSYQKLRKNLDKANEKLKLVTKEHPDYKNTFEEFQKAKEKLEKYEKEPEEYKKIEHEKEKLIKKVTLKETLAFLIFVVVSICGLMWQKAENKRQEEERRKKYPKADVKKIQNFFEQEKTFADLSHAEEIKNKEIEDTMKSIVDLAKKENAIYLVYGENGIGKSSAMRKVLSETSNLQYLYIENGIEELTKYLVPDYDSKTSHFTIEEVIRQSLTDYGDYRRQMKEKRSENAIIVFDNTNKLEDEKFLKNFKDIIKITLVDNNRPVVFIFLSSEGKGPQILMRNMSRMRVTRIKEPSKQIAFDYFKKIGIPSEYHSELEKLTGSAFKYLNELSSIDRNLPKDEFIKTSKKNVHSKIQPEIREWLKIPEIVDVCCQILKEGSIDEKEFDNITKNDIKSIEETWQKKILKGNLFQIDEGNVVFQNRATKQYVKEYLKK
jgi:energy-coupling factor transporter ATP-binding protein EcfA2